MFFNGTKVLLNLTHLPFTEIIKQYLIFFIGLGHFVQEKKYFAVFLPQKVVLFFMLVISVSGKSIK